MRQSAVVFALLILGACQSETEAKIEALQSDLASVRAELAGCDSFETILMRKQGEKSLGEWDMAAGKDVGDIPPDQEWEIRKSLGAEMNLAPSEVNGWKEIYKSRAKTAQINRGSQSRAIETARLDVDRMCADKLKNFENEQQLVSKIEALGGVV